MAKLIDNAADFGHALEILNRSGTTLVLDTETTGLRMFARNNPARLCGISIGPAFDLSTENDFYFAFRHGEGPNLSLELMQPLRELLRNKTVLYHNAAFDVKILWCDGFELPPVILDTIVAAHLANELEESFALKELGATLFGKDAVSEDRELREQLRAKKYGKGDMWRLSAAAVAPYALADIRLTKMLYANRLAELERWRLVELFHERCEFLLELIRTEIRGIHLDTDEVHRQMDRIGPLLDIYAERLHRLLGPEVNLQSPKQLCKALGVDSTDKAFLEELLTRGPREDVKTLLDYRAILKARSTYFEPFLELVDQHGRLHTSYRIHGTVTHRLSSSDPNLQTASRDQNGRIYSVRACLAAPPGTFLLEADYASVEPRLTAHYSKDPDMLEAFRRGYDFHSNTARYLFDTKQISKEQRHTAKTFGLAVIYGLGALRAAKQLGLRHNKMPDGSWAPHHDLVWAFSPEGALTQYPCSVVDAEFCTCAGKEFRSRYYGAVPELEPTMRAVRNKAREIGYIRNPLTGAVQRFDERFRNPFKAFNALVQNSAAEVLRRSFTKLSKMFTRPEDPRIVLTVHDSIAFEMNQDKHAPENAKVIKEVMENTTKIDVPLEVELKVGYNLSNMGIIRA